MKLSARNQFKGIVKSVTLGAVNAVVVVEIEGDQLVTADITLQSVQELGLAEGKEAYVVIKSTDVMIGIDH